MRCSICGAQLKKEGDLCSNCYKEFQEDEDLKKDTNEVFRVKRKYKISYEIIKYTEILLIFILCAVVFLITGSIGEFFVTLGIFVLIFGFLLFWDKRLAMGTQAVFYEKKVVYTFKFLFINTRKVLKYEDIQDITCFQTFRQKKAGMGDICVYAKGFIPATGFLKGFQVKEVENVAENIQKIREIVKVNVK